jgi:uncharacterized protein (UPF0332 family)
MTEENRRAAAKAEWLRSCEALEEAEILHQAGRPAGAVSRAYYAAFHAARALLVSISLQPRTHEGVRSMLSLHFVRTGRLDARLARALSLASRTREDADYDAAAVFGPADSEESLSQARIFVAAAKQILEQDGFL